jgi:ATP/maltotriose-dependent transcriptional regulator MalT
LALVVLGRFDETESVLAPYESAASSAGLATSSDYLFARMRALLRGSSPDEVRSAVLERARSWHDDPEWDGALAAEHAWAAFYAGQLADALRQSDLWANDERVSPLRRVHMHIVAVNVYYRLARFEDGLALTETAEQLAAGMDVVPTEVRLVLRSARLHPAIAAARDLNGTAAVLLAATAEAKATGDGAALSSTSMLLGHLALQRGHAAEALAYLDEATAALTDADALNDALYAATMRSTAHALHGDAGRAGAVMEQIERLADEQPRNAEKHAVLIDTARALIDGCAGRTSAAADQLLVVADAGHNHPAGEITALYEALRHGADPRTVATRLRVRLGDAQHELGELFADHADALAGDDAATQMSIAKRFHDLGCDLFAAEAAARAAHSFAGTGRSALSREAASLATKYADPCGTVYSWALQFRPEAPTLTGREREIAVLAARGRTNKQIAGDLFLSVRTVESHLLNACQKLGVANRRKLVDVIDH